MNLPQPIGEGTPRVKTWSFSSLKTFEKCPYRTYLERIEKAPLPALGDDPNHPLTRGQRLHKEAELFVTGAGPFTSDLKRFREYFAQLKDAYQEGQVEVEQKWGFTRHWEPTGWYDKDCWLWVKADAVWKKEGSWEAIDYKSGKDFAIEIPHGQQMQLYAIAALARYPEIDHIIGSLWYLDTGKIRSRVYSRAAVPVLANRWQQRSDKLTQAIAYPPKANQANCKYCPYSPNEAGNGYCPYGVEVELKRAR